jgi:1,4-alpha-glucan branching enzyme
MSKRPRQPSQEPARQANKATAPKPAAKGKASDAKPTTAKPAAKATAKPEPAKPAKPPAAKASAATTRASAAKTTASATETAATKSAKASAAKPTEAATKAKASAATKTTEPAAKPAGVSARAIQQAARAAETATKPKPPGRVRKAVESVIAYAEEVIERVTGGAEPTPLTAYLAEPVPEDSSSEAATPAPAAYLAESVRPGRRGPEDSSPAEPVAPAAATVHLADRAEPRDSLDVRVYVSEATADPGEAPVQASQAEPRTINPELRGNLADSPTPDPAPGASPDASDPFSPAVEVVGAAPGDAIDVDADTAADEAPAGPDSYLDPDALAGRVSPIPAAYLAEPARTPAAVVYLADPAPRPAVDPTPAPHPGPGLGELDFHLLAEGTHLRLHERLGAQVQPDGGVHFAVWAPNARQVSVIGEWNRWHPTRDVLTRHPSGVWQGLVADAAPGMLYKYRVVGMRGEVMDRADPVAFASEGPPQTASRIATLTYEWRDDAWLRARAERQGPRAPISVYEMHVGSWLRGAQGDWLGYREVAPRLIAHLQALGFTHVEFMPLTEHPFYGSWGYQTSAYFAPSARYGGPQALMYLIDELHRAGIGVILDWVPGHFPADDHGLGRFDGTYLYEHRDPRRGHQPDWNTLIFNLGRHEVRAFLLSSAMMWIDRYHVDAIRVDAVASMLYLDYSRKEGEWVPNQFGGRENLEAVAFLRELNAVIHTNHPGVITIAEESTAWPMVTGPIDRGGLGFDYKWDMGWMHDSLRYLGRDPVVRQHHHNELTFRMWYAYNERYMLPLSHDEVVHGKGSLILKMHGDARAKFAGLRLLLAYMFTTPGKKLLFMGAEFAQIREWNHDRQLDWALRQLPMHAGLERWVARLAHLYRDDAALHELDHDPAGFEWLVVDDRMRSLAVYLRLPRRGPVLMIALNFTPVTWSEHRIGVPAEGTWTLVDRSDAVTYTDEPDASPVELPSLVAVAEPSHDRPFSITLTLPPLTALVFSGPEAGELRAAAERHRTERLAREAAELLAAEAAAVADEAASGSSGADEVATKPRAGDTSDERGRPGER